MQVNLHQLYLSSTKSILVYQLYTISQVESNNWIEYVK